jgi:hypothetical protein
VELLQFQEEQGAQVMSWFSGLFLGGGPERRRARHQFAEWSFW